MTNSALLCFVAMSVATVRVLLCMNRNIFNFTKQVIYLCKTTKAPAQTKHFTVALQSHADWEDIIFTNTLARLKRATLLIIGVFFISVTFDCNLCHCFDHTQRGHGYAGVVGRLANIREFQDISSNGHVVLRGKVLWAQHPFDIGHGRAHCHTGDVHTAPWHDLIIRGRDRETWRNPSNCKIIYKAVAICGGNVRQNNKVNCV